MKHTHASFASIAVLSLMAISAASQSAPVSARIGWSQEVHSAAGEREDNSVERVAKRLQARIERRFDEKPSLSTLMKAIETRRQLLSRSVNVQFTEITTRPEGPQALPTMIVSLQRFPTWLTFSLKSKAGFELSPEVIAAELERDRPEGLLRPMHAQMTGTKEQWGLTYAAMTGVSQPGHTYDYSALAGSIVEALENGTPAIEVKATFENATVIAADGQTWELLGSGRSEFATSPAGRKANVRKAINEQLNGVIVQPGDTFSFNNTLGGPITKSRGWQDSLIIVNGRDLEPAPGGGICQAATTMYRALIMSGMPVVARKPHSLYVHYYEKFGLGLDATVFPKRQDLTFVNDTGHAMLVQAYTVGDEAVVNLFGRSDGRSVTMDGPYMASNAPADLLVNGRPIRTNEIVWRQTIHKPTGDETKLIVSGYNMGVPHKSLSIKYADGKGVAELYTDMPLPL